jgi:hypothetical protein
VVTVVDEVDFPEEVVIVEVVAAFQEVEDEVSSKFHCKLSLAITRSVNGRPMFRSLNSRNPMRARVADRRVRRSRR